MQVYAVELVVSGIWKWEDWSSQVLCWIVKHVSKNLSSKYWWLSINMKT